MSRLTSPAALAACGAAAVAVAVWWADPTARRWQDVCAVAVSPDGRTVAAGAYSGKSFNEDFHWCIGDVAQTVALFDAATGADRGSLDQVRYGGIASAVAKFGQFLAFAPDGRTLAVGHWDGGVKLWESSTGRVAGVLKAESPRVTAVAFSADGRVLAAADRCWFTVWDAADPAAGRRFDTAAWTRAVTVSADGARVAVGDDVWGATEVWDVAAEKRIGTAPAERFPAAAVAFSPDGRTLALGGDKSVLAWELEGVKARFEVEAPWTAGLAFSPDGQTLASAGAGGVRVWDAATGQPRGPVLSASRYARAVAFGPDGTWLVAAGGDGSVTALDVATGTRRWSAEVPRPWPVTLGPVFVATGGMVVMVFALVGGRRHKRRSIAQPSRQAAGLP